MFLEQPRPHFPPSLKPTTINLARKETHLSVSTAIVCSAIYSSVQVAN